ncbi:hypothetical protein [Mycobacterium simiae]|uniref:hypothetical protein n=1 Tax=Mycobacterium simiae TaxID=1784 RepID=UPI000CB354F4|nr:hypothetical protein [Mycobacterium simiae]PLV44945.1 hypothetical protein X011_25650 [Mycobacterium tuberculosis variant microti OV254]BBX38926.1 hypothetical protein MSIM_03770 [Mycobacterium simiae]
MTADELIALFESTVSIDGVEKPLGDCTPAEALTAVDQFAGFLRHLIDEGPQHT